MDKYLEEAIAEYERKIETGKPFYMDASVLMDIEEYYEKNDRPFDVERIMRFAEKLHPGNDDVMIVKAYRLKARGKWTEAENLINSVTDRDSRDVKLFFIEKMVAEGQIYAGEKEFGNCLQNPDIFEEEKWEWMHDFSEILLDYGYATRALHYLSSIPNNYPQRNNIDELLGETYYQLQNYEGSIKYFGKLVDFNVYDSLSWTQLADAQSKAGHYKDCLNSCDYALAIDDTNERAMELMLYASVTSRGGEETMQLFEKYAAKAPNDYVIFMYWGETLSNMNNHVVAAEKLQKALRLCPMENADRHRLITDLAATQTVLGQYDAACELMFSLTLTGESPVNICIHLADAFLDRNQEEKSASLFMQALKSSECTDKDYAAIIRILIRERNFSLVMAPVWEKVSFRKYTPEYQRLYAYTSYANYIMHISSSFLLNLEMATRMCPDDVCEIFKDVFHTSDIQEIIQKALSVTDTWSQSSENKRNNDCTEGLLEKYPY